MTAPRSRQITIPAPYHSDFSGRMPFVSRKSTESTCNIMALSSNNSNHINPNQNIKIMHQSDCTVITFSQTDQYDYFKPYLDTSWRCKARHGTSVQPNECAACTAIMAALWSTYAKANSEVLPNTVKLWKMFVTVISLKICLVGKLMTFIYRLI